MAQHMRAFLCFGISIDLSLMRDDVRSQIREIAAQSLVGDRLIIQAEGANSRRTFVGFKLDMMVDTAADSGARTYNISSRIFAIDHHVVRMCDDVLRKIDIALFERDYHPHANTVVFVVD